MELQLNTSRFNNMDGVSCYMVSILHILQQIPSLCKFIIYDRYITSIEEKITDENDISKFVIYELAKTIKLSLNNNNVRITPYSFKKIMGNKNKMWSAIEQQDSQEFYNYLIAKIEEECGQNIEFIPEIIKKNNSDELININTNILQLLALKYIHKSESKDYSPIKNMFIGYLISNTQCCYCYTDSPCFESFITLSLSIPVNKYTNMHTIYSLQECLNNMIIDEQLDKDNKLQCDICGIKNQSIKKIQIWKAPQILVIQLKRFITDAFGNNIAKIINPVTYPVDNFNISKYFHPDSCHRYNAIYKLIGINVHREMEFGSINVGHYVSIVRHKNNNKWYVYDDDRELEELEENEIQNRNAYLLFYYKIN